MMNIIAHICTICYRFNNSAADDFSRIVTMVMIMVVVAPFTLYHKNSRIY